MQHTTFSIQHVRCSLHQATYTMQHAAYRFGLSHHFDVSHSAAFGSDASAKDEQTVPKPSTLTPHATCWVCRTVSHAPRYPTRHGLLQPTEISAEELRSESLSQADATVMQASPLRPSPAPFCSVLQQRVVRCGATCCGALPSGRSASPVQQPRNPTARMRRRRSKRIGWNCTAHISTGTGHALPTSAAGPGPPLPHLHRDWAHSAHICTGTGPTAAG